MKKYNAYQLKLAMAALMVLDHIYIIPGLVSPSWEGIFHALTRCVGVYFAYMAVEGFIHTRNLKAYLLRLFSWGMFMAGGNALLNLLYQSRQIHLENNIFLTLAMGVLMLTFFYRFSSLSKGWYLVAGVLTLLAGSFLTEGGIVILPFMLISYVCRERKILRNSLYLLLSAFLLIMSYTACPSWQETLEMLLYNSDFLFISVLLLLALYNGERGPKTSFSKYFFYVFYPAHLWLLATLAFFMAG
ncbi:TraX family protein [Streptococcus massiliensis]|uniref:TraX family protein n=1 Tax=Streptococcus massiliensis TaxID=313439 RepID=A0A380L4L3_9STRE|nr:TraX family protein [Streptococcus massiliensis]SUN77421.1 TraX family protein [Streptococcus massiliensis]